MKNLLFLLLCFSAFSCVQKTHQRTVNFSIDMRGVSKVKTVSMQGDFEPLNWKKNFELLDADGDSIYTAQVIFDTPYKFVSVKFIKNQAEYELKDQGNRRVYFEENAPTIYQAIFNQKN